MAESHRDEIAKLEALFSAHPDGRVFTHLAEAYRRSGELDKAREILEEGLSRHAEYPSAHVVLGRVLWDERRIDDAAGAFHRVLELDRQNLVALRALGDLAREAGRTEDALRHYRELSTLDPGNEEVEAIIQALEGSDAAAPAAPEVDARADPDELGLEPTAIGIEPAAPAEGPPAADAAANLDAAQDEAAGPATDAPVVTETMADLYAQQGLFDRAVETYRELLQDRPADADRLSRKLAEVEARAAAHPGAGASAAPARPVDRGPESPFDPAAFQTGRGESEPVEAAPLEPGPLDFDALEPGPVELDPLEAAPLDVEPAAVEGGPSAPAEGDAWAAEVGPLEPEAAQPSAGPAAGESHTAPEEEVPSLPELELRPEWEVEKPAGADAAVSDIAEAPAAGAGVDGGAVVEPGPAGGTGAPAPPGLPGISGAPAEAGPIGETGGPTIGEYFRSLLDWRPTGPDTPEPAAPAVGAEPAAPSGAAGNEGVERGPFVAPGSDEFDLLFATERQQGADPLAGTGPPDAPGTADEEADDNDLEMFRAWLQNLKR